MFAKFVFVLVLATAVSALSWRTDANPINANSYFAPYMHHFDYWARCKDRRIEPVHRMDYCRAMIGGGHGDDADAMIQIGLAYMDLQKYDSAAESFQAAMDYFSADALSEARDDLDEALVLGGHYDRALNDVNAEIAKTPEEAGPYNERCWIRAVAGKELDEALADCNNALRIASDDAQAFDSRGLVNFKLGKLKDSGADYDAALKLVPHLASSLFMRGVIKLRNGDEAGGASDIASSKEKASLIAEEFAAYGVEP